MSALLIAYYQVTAKLTPFRSVPAIFKDILYGTLTNIPCFTDKSTQLNSARGWIFLSAVK